MTLLRAKTVRITRNSLRPPFFSQCYVAAPFAFILVRGFDFLSPPQDQGVLQVLLQWQSPRYGMRRRRSAGSSMGIGATSATAIFLGALLFATVAASLITALITLDAKTSLPQPVDQPTG